MGRKKFQRYCPGIEREPLSESEMSMICIMNRAYRSWPKGVETLPVGSQIPGDRHSKKENKDE
jgi:hypothetical protein